MIQRFALLVGINEYQLAGKNLAGSANDVRQFRALLREFFPEVKITTLASPARPTGGLPEGPPTRQGIIDAWSRLVNDAAGAAGNGDEVVVIGYFSGHGSVLKHSEAGAESSETKNFESIVPADSRVPDNENKDVFDKEINAALWQLYDAVDAAGGRSPSVTLIFDSCFSGEASREGVEVPEGVQPKVLGEDAGEAPLPEDEVAADAERRRRAERKAALVRRLQILERRHRDADAKWAPRGSRAVVIAACQDHEIAGERVFGTSSFGNFSFFFHRFLRQALEKSGARRRITWREVFPRVQRLLQDGEVAEVIHNQSPQFFEGSLDQQVFGVHEDSSAAYLQVTRAAPEVVLAGGAAHGVESGSIWQIRPAWAHQPSEGTPIAEVRIETVEALRAFASTLEAFEPIEAGQRAFLTRPAAPIEEAAGAGAPLVVFVQAPKVKRFEQDRLEAEIRDSPALQLGARDRAEVVIQALPPSGEPLPGFEPAARWHWRAETGAGGVPAGALAARRRAIGTDLDVSLRAIECHLRDAGEVLDRVLNSFPEEVFKAAVEEAAGRLRDQTRDLDDRLGAIPDGAGDAAFLRRLRQYLRQAAGDLETIPAALTAATDQEFSAVMRTCVDLKGLGLSMASRVEHLSALVGARALELVRDLERVVRWRQLRGDSGRQGRRGFEDVSVTADASLEEDDDGNDVVALQVRIEYLAGPGADPVWITPVRFDVNREISLPLGPSALRLAPGEVLVLSDDGKAPGGFTWAAVKVLITDRAADFAYYEQAPVLGTTSAEAARRAGSPQQLIEPGLDWLLFPPPVPADPASGPAAGEDSSSPAAGAGRWTSKTVEITVRT